jgi:purine-binding chemotaxis protein CheW
VSEALVHLRVGGRPYAIPVRCVLEIVPFGDVVNVPGARRAALGVRNLRGEVLPVFDLEASLGQADAMRREHLVVVESDAVKAALAVDEVVDVGGAGDPDATEVDIPAVFRRLQGVGA